METVRLYGPDGRLIQREDLKRDVAKPSLTGIRNVFGHNAVSPGLSPSTLATLLLNAANGLDSDAYLTLAEEMEERDLHYASVLGTRKRSVSGLPVKIEAASDDKEDVKIADAVRELVRKPEFGQMIDDALDALGKGFAAIEIMWDRSKAKWFPYDYIWRDPRFFMFDRETGQELRLKDEKDVFNGIPLPPYKFIVHYPRLKTGIPIRGGLARLVSIAYMCKSYAITDWLAFSEVFGMPLRLGKYGPGATDKDIRTLINAVANIGTDAAAVIPEGMIIEFKDGAGSRGGEILFANFANWIDKQVSKAVLGQVASTEGTPGKLGNDTTQEEVRQDIIRSDAGCLARTIDKYLIKPFVDLNFGVRDAYPTSTLFIDDPQDIELMSKALERLVPLGLKVQMSEVRDMIGFSDPDKDAELLGASTATAPNRVTMALNRQDPEDDLDDLELDGLGDWEEQMEPIVEPIKDLIEKSDSFDDFIAGLSDIIGEMDTAEIVKRLAVEMFKARGAGDVTDG